MNGKTDSLIFINLKQNDSYSNFSLGTFKKHKRKYVQEKVNLTQQKKQTKHNNKNKIKKSAKRKNCCVQNSAKNINKNEKIAKDKEKLKQVIFDNAQN